MRFKLSQLADLPNEDQDVSSYTDLNLNQNDVLTNEQQEVMKQFPGLNIMGAIAYNKKSETYFKEWEQDIKNALGTSADWTSEQFAKDVYNWQKNNGLTGKLIDGKFGPITASTLAKVNEKFGQEYNPYYAYHAKGADEKPYPRVIALIPEIKKVQNEMGATDVPLAMLCGWIQVESGGRIADTTSLGEVGLFQISPQEAQTLDVNMDKAASDIDYSISSGIKLARYHSERLDSILSQYPTLQTQIQKGSDLYWKFAMFGFSAGDATLAQLLANMAKSGLTFSSWDDVMKFVAANPYGYKHSPLKWTSHVQMAFMLGNKMVNNLSSKASLRVKNVAKITRAMVFSKLNK